MARLILLLGLSDLLLVLKISTFRGTFKWKRVKIIYLLLLPPGPDLPSHGGSPRAAEGAGPGPGLASSCRGHAALVLGTEVRKIEISL